MKNNNQIPLGSHIYSPRLGGLYNHHGIYIGNGQVVQYSGFSKGLCSGPINKIIIENFMDGNDQLTIRFYKKNRFSPQEIVKRALSRIGEDQYDLFKKNCEHFATWVHTDKEGGFEFNKLAGKVLDVIVIVGQVAAPPPAKAFIWGVKVVQGIYDHIKQRQLGMQNDVEVGDQSKTIWGKVLELLPVWRNIPDISAPNPAEYCMDFLREKTKKTVNTVKNVTETITRRLSNVLK